MSDRETQVSIYEGALDSTLSAGATSINVVSTSGVPSVPFYVVIDPDDDSKREVILVDGSTTGTTMVLSSAASRGQDGTSDVEHASGATVGIYPVPGLWTDINDRVDGSVAVAGDTMTGPLVLSGDATSALQAVPKQQLDNATSGGVSPSNVKGAGSFLYGTPGWAFTTLAAVDYLADGDLTSIPIFVNPGRTYDRLSISVSTAGSAGSLARLGIYNYAADGVPGTLVLDAGTVAVDSTGIKEATVSQTLAAGMYFLAIVHDSTSNIQLETPSTGSVMASPTTSFGTSAITNIGRPLHLKTGRIADVAGGLVSPAPASSSMDLLARAWISMREVL